MWICKQCGKENQNDRVHCWECSTPKDETAVMDECPPSPVRTHDVSNPNFEAEEIIRAELQRRRMPEPEPTVRTVDENTGSGNPVVQTKYPALRVISVIFKVLAVLAAIAGLIGVLVGLVQMSGNTYGASAAGGVIVLVSLLYGGLGCIYMLAISEGISVFIDIEENTRLTNRLLTKLLDK